MPDTTARFSLQKPIRGAAEPVTEYLDYIRSGFQSIDDLGAQFLQGTFAGRPTSSGGTPGRQGRFYYATDTGQVFYDFGTGWVEVGAFTKLEDVAHSFTRDEDTTWPATGKVVGYFYVSLATGESASLTSVAHVLSSGSGTVFKLQRSTGGGSFSDISGFTGITPSTTLGLTNPDDVTLASGDWIRLICTTQGTGKGGAVVPVTRRSR